MAWQPGRFLRLSAKQENAARRRRSAQAFAVFWVTFRFEPGLMNAETHSGSRGRHEPIRSYPLVTISRRANPRQFNGSTRDDPLLGMRRRITDLAKPLNEVAQWPSWIGG